MKKSNGKKLLALFMAAILCLSMSVITVSAKVPDSGSTTTPKNIAITATDNSLRLGALGKLECYGRTSVQNGYTAETIVELQQSNSWHTIQTWSRKGGTSSSIDQDYYVVSGYSYRLKITHKAYNSSGTCVETITKYSTAVDY